MPTRYSDELSKHLDFSYHFIISSAFPLLRWKLLSGQTKTAQIVIRAPFQTQLIFTEELIMRYTMYTLMKHKKLRCAQRPWRVFVCCVEHWIAAVDEEMGSDVHFGWLLENDGSYCSHSAMTTQPVFLQGLKPNFTCKFTPGI